MSDNVKLRCTLRFLSAFTINRDTIWTWDFCLATCEIEDTERKIQDLINRDHHCWHTLAQTTSKQRNQVTKPSFKPLRVQIARSLHDCVLSGSQLLTLAFTVILWHLLWHFHPKQFPHEGQHWSLSTVGNLEVCTKNYIYSVKRSAGGLGDCQQDTVRKAWLEKQNKCTKKQNFLVFTRLEP